MERTPIGSESRALTVSTLKRAARAAMLKCTAVEVGPYSDRPGVRWNAAYYRLAGGL